MNLNVERVKYENLTAKQREIYNFQKAAAALADYGFNCIKLHDDWKGADFLAHHKDGEVTLKVQLKGRGLTIAQKYVGKDLYICFLYDGDWYLIPHDELVGIVGRLTRWLKTESWQTQGQYYAGRLSKSLLSAIEEFRLT